jgi:hypothetical protein
MQLKTGTTTKLIANDHLSRCDELGQHLLRTIDHPPRQQLVDARVSAGLGGLAYAAVRVLSYSTD